MTLINYTALKRSSTEAPLTPIAEHVNVEVQSEEHVPSMSISSKLSKKNLIVFSNHYS